MLAPRPSTPIGPATEARILAAFADGCTITADAAARLLGFDVKTLRAMTDAGVIRAVLRGVKTRAYTEGDIRAYLMEGAAPVREEQPRPAPKARPAHLRVVPFSQRPKPSRPSKDR